MEDAEGAQSEESVMLRSRVSGQRCCNSVGACLNKTPRCLGLCHLRPALPEHAARRPVMMAVTLLLADLSCMSSLLTWSNDSVKLMSPAQHRTLSMASQSQDDHACGVPVFL